MALYDNPNATTPAAPATTSPIIDPYTRGLVAQGIQSGTMYDIVSQAGYEAERTRREALLRESVVPAAQATLQTGLRTVESTMEKAGKLSSSAAAAAQMRTSELYGAQVAGTMAAGTLNLYEQMATERSNELNRVLASGQTATQAETQLYATDVNRQIAQIQDYTTQQIAQLNASTTLSVADKQAQVQALQNQSQERIAQLQATTAIATANIGAGASKYGVDIGQTIAGMQTASQERIAELQGNIALSAQDKQKEIALLNDRTNNAIANVQAQTARYGVDIGSQVARLQNESAEKIAQIQADTSLTNADKQIKIADLQAQTDKDVAGITGATALAVAQVQAGAGISVANISATASKYAVDANQATAMAQLAEQTRQFNIATTEGATEFWASYDVQMKTAGTDEKYKSALIEMAKADLFEKSRTFDLTRQDQVNEFLDNLYLEQSKFGADTAYKNQMYELAQSQFKASLNQFDLTRQDDVNKFWASLDVQKTATNADAAYKAGMVKVAQDTLTQEMNKFDLSSADQRDQFDRTFEQAQTESSFDQVYKTNMYDMAKTTYLGTCHQFDVTNENDMTKFTAMQTWEKDKFDFFKDDQLAGITAQTAALVQGTKDSAVATQLNNILAVLKDDVVRNEIDAAGLGDVLGKVIENGLANWLTSTPTDDLTPDAIRGWIKTATEPRAPLIRKTGVTVHGRTVSTTGIEI